MERENQTMAEVAKTHNKKEPNPSNKQRELTQSNTANADLNDVTNEPQQTGAVKKKNRVSLLELANTRILLTPNSQANK